MAHQGYAGLRVQVAEGVARVTIDHPPINLLDLALIGDLDRLTRELAADDEVRVVVFASANPDFFVAHADVRLIQALPAEAGPRATELGEVAVGIIPGGCGTQRLPRLVGRGRALEIVLGGGDFPADVAERYGWVNRALPPAELGPFVDALAQRIASFPASAIALAKRAVEAAEPSPVPGLLEEAHPFQRSLATPAARERMAAFLALGGQTPEVERRGFPELPREPRAG